MRFIQQYDTKVRQYFACIELVADQCWEGEGVISVGAGVVPGLLAAGDRISTCKTEELTACYTRS